MAREETVREMGGNEPESAQQKQNDDENTGQSHSWSI
jgi:hypothetical protein